MSLIVDAISIYAGRRCVVADLSFTIERGEAVTLMGPSGSGKSSVLGHCIGLLPPGLRGAGRIHLDGTEVTHLPPHRRRIGLLFQDDLLFPHLSVGGNLLFGLHEAVRGRAARRAAVLAALDDADLAGMIDSRPAALSGGQRARIGLLRVLLSRPAALLLDEPFSGLDVALRERFRALVFSRARAAGLPLLLVTHDPADATGRILHLPPRDPSERPAAATGSASRPPSGR